MDVDYFAEKMECSARVIQQMTVDLSAEQAAWKPSPEAWSALEVVNHLHDEECEDFRLGWTSCSTEATSRYPRSILRRGCGIATTTDGISASRCELSSVSDMPRSVGFGP